MAELVVRNGIVAKKPEWMDDDYWLEYEAPRIGKRYGGRRKGVPDMLYGMEYDIHNHNDGPNLAELTDEEKFGTSEEGDCAGGGCKI